MKPSDLILRCYAEKEGDIWVAVCVDLSLAAQSSTLQDARHRLHRQIDDYIREALTVDKEHAESLLNRKAPFSQISKYYFIKLIGKYIPVFDGKRHKTFTDLLPFAAA